MEEHRSYNVGESDYSKHKYQVWDIWRDFKLDPFEADIVKRILRKKKGEKNDIEKIKHIIKEMINELEFELKMCKFCFELIEEDYDLTDLQHDMLYDLLLGKLKYRYEVLSRIKERMENL